MFDPIKRVLILIAVFGTPLCAAETPDRVLSLSHPGVKWILQVELPGALEQYNQYKEGAGSYAYGQTQDNQMRFSMVIHQYPGATDAKSCRDAELQNARKNKLLAGFKFDSSESGESAYLRVSGTAQVEGRSLYSQHLHRFVHRDGLCAKAHLSSTLDDGAIAKDLAQAVGSMSLKESVGEIARSFHVPPKGTFKLSMPAHWGFQTSNPSGAPARMLTIRTPDGNFQFMATVFFAPAEQKESAQSTTRKAAEAARDRTASEAVQTQIDIRSLKGSSAEGHYIFITDKSLVGKPAMPNNWKHMRQGMLKVGAAFATFTVFSNDENSPDALGAMRALENIAFTSDK